MDDHSGGTKQGIEKPHRENLSPQDIKGTGDKYNDNPHKNNRKKWCGNQDHYSYFDWYQRTDNFTAVTRPHLKASLSDKLIWADMTLNNRKQGQSPVIDYVKYNRLIHEKSPYLLQHATNPVDWYPWGAEAFLRAAKEGKPVFLSIGYATCHWCHVMAHESFEDSAIAALLNRDFICIKVDREERPDIDSIYMSVCQMMTGQGGWPLTIIMTSDKKPFFAGTYFPKESRFGMIGLIDLIARITRLWHENQKDLFSSADQITQALHQEPDTLPADVPGISLLNSGYEELALRFDPEYGGFSRAPKFPTPHTLLFLLRFWRRTGNKRALLMVDKTLREMQSGGIFDHLGGGFHRYSTDKQWRVPHFEKMLYDQALLIMAYTDAYQALKKQIFRKTAEKIITYTLRDLISPEGAFYSAEDADSAGGEGSFYLWTPREMETILGKDDAMYAMRAFHVTPSGNYHAAESKNSQNILFLQSSMTESECSPDLKPGPELLLDSIMTRLFTARTHRPRPSLDDKILADWNGLFIAALAQAARTFKNEDYLTAARRAMDFILTQMRDSEGRLWHRFRDGEPAIPAFADDYAFTIKALIELYESSFEPSYLRSAIELNTLFLDHFWDNMHGGFFTISDDAEVLLIRKKEFYDGAIPSCNSVALENLIRLAHLTGETKTEERAFELSRCFVPYVHKSPSAYTWFLCTLDTIIGPLQDVVIAGGRDADDTGILIRALHEHYFPHLLVICRFPGAVSDLLNSIAPFTQNMHTVGGKATAYICTGHSCTVPTTESEKMLELLSALNSGKTPEKVDTNRI
jgi:uncharacterized protein YyaL (SSP411 family)